MTTSSAIPVDDAARRRHLAAAQRAGASAQKLVRALRALPFAEACDMLRCMVAADAAASVTRLREAADALAASPADSSTPLQALLDLQAAVLQAQAAAAADSGADDEALTAAARALNILVQDTRRKDDAFLETLALLLADMAGVHARREEYRSAERELDKSLKILARLARTHPARYAPAHMALQAAAADVCASRRHQAELLARHQADTTQYLEMVNSGSADAAELLIESLRETGLTLARMGRHREAVAFYSRALRYLGRLRPDFGPLHLDLSVDLGEALLHAKSTRDKGVHLLNTMLQKAAAADDAATHRRVSALLARAGSRRFDILGLWYKLFPR